MYLRVTRLTEWMLGCILISDPLPCTSISTLGLLVPAILLIITIDLLLMQRCADHVNTSYDIVKMA